MRRRIGRKTSDVFLLQVMQQYFVNQPLGTGMEYIFTREQAHHAKDVLHLDHERIRLVSDGKGYFAEAYADHGVMKALVQEEDPAVNELSFPLLLAMALIRREKFELILQKAAELGVSGIIPFESSRCVVHLNQEKKQKQLERWKAILQSASEQCKRNKIPSIQPGVSIEALKDIPAASRLCAYEKAGMEAECLSACMDGKSTLVVIGPEGGFSMEEIDFFQANGIRPVTLGKRILRAETAAIYACSIISEWDLRHHS